MARLRMGGSKNAPLKLQELLLKSKTAGRVASVLSFIN